MKTKNNVQKAIFKSMAIIASFVLIGLTVNAQDFWRTVLENNSLNEIAISMVNTNTIAFSTKLETGNNSLKLFAEESEAPLELESWMIDDEYFGISMIGMETEVETPLDLESWMIDESYFNTNFSVFEVETENPLELESWMVDENFGTTKEDATLKQVDQQQEQENSLEMEPWMLANNNWK